MFACAAGLMTMGLRKNPARIRHWVWLAASLKFLIPFAPLVELGSRIEWRAPSTISPKVSVVVEVAQPFTIATGSAPVSTALPQSSSPLPALLFAVWACGFTGLSISWWIRWRRVSVAVRAGSPVQLSVPIRAVSSASILEPGVFGVIRPVLLLPDGILDHLSPEQCKAVVAHELCHIRHRDNLIALVQMFVESVFWFYPLVWWIGKRIYSERERACDEEVLRLGNERRTYAQGILKVCELYLESPVPCVAGVSGSDLRNRIEEIMSNQIRFPLSFGRKVILGMAAVTAVTLPVTVGMLNAPAVQAQSAAQTAPASAKFAVASIKPAAPDSEHFMFGIRPMPGGRISATNVTLKMLIARAYDLQGFQLSGGPGWADTQRYNIEAKPDTPVENQWKEMLQNLLADRFQLVFHRETKELPIYALLPARKDGKLGPGLVESKDGDCTERDPSKPGPPAPGRPPYCGSVLVGAGQMNGAAASVGDVAKMLSFSVGRKVIDKTGLTGRYAITLRYAPDQSQRAMAPPGAPPPAAPGDSSLPSLFTALQEQLGLKLESQKGPVEVFVIDRAEKPSEN